MRELFQLSLHLTAAAERAEQCLTRAMKDCFGTKAVSRGFAGVWTRRQIIRNAIQLVQGIDNSFAGSTDSEFPLQPNEYRIEDLRNSVAILELPDLERLPFVICVLERLSILDCALLLRRSPKEVNDAIMRHEARLGRCTTAGPAPIDIFDSSR